MASLVVTIKSSNADILSSKRNDAEGIEALREICNALDAYTTGCAKGVVSVQSSADNPVKASGTLTLDTVIATDVFVIGATTFTGTDTPTTILHFDTSLATDTLIAADAARVVNAHATANKIVTASSSGAVLTITANVPGPVGNFINISSVDSTITASAATLASGAGGATNAASTHTFGE